MSQHLINNYLKQPDLIKKVGGSSRETILREARVTIVSVEAERITKAMKAAAR